MIQVIAALRYWGRAMEMGSMPRLHPMVAGRFRKLDCSGSILEETLPLTLDEIETLIGRLDGTFVGRGLRTWDGGKYL
jgi:hypothetical protein